MKLSMFFLLLKLTFIAPAFASTENPDQPTYTHCTFFKETEGLRHVVDDLIEEISLRSNLTFKNINAPIKRCIQMMVAGEVDFIASLRVDAYTTKHMTFLFVSEGMSRIIFFTRKSDGNWLNNYADLQGKYIGTTTGFGYFDKFDQDESVKKFNVSNTKQLPMMLKAGRIDAYATYSGLMDSGEENPDLSKAPYSFAVKMSMLAIGKNSPLQSQNSLLEGVVGSILADGTMNKYMQKYLPEYNPPAAE
jgi:ABC-type amino acid transport substrate-binding protein